MLTCMHHKNARTVPRVTMFTALHHTAHSRLSLPHIYDCAAVPSFATGSAWNFLSAPRCCRTVVFVIVTQILRSNYHVYNIFISWNFPHWVSHGCVTCRCRLNVAPVKGYEKDVGSKTTMRITYPEGAFQDQRLYEKRSLFVLSAFKPLDLKWLRSIVFKEKEVGHMRGSCKGHVLIATLSTGYDQLLRQKKCTVSAHHPETNLNPPSSLIE